jgi:lactoylglutathione lyase
LAAGIQRPPLPGYSRSIASRAFPVVFAANVARTASFYEELGFERHFQLPAEGDPGYIGLRRAGNEIAVVAAEWPDRQYGLLMAEGVRFEMFVYVDDLDHTVDRLRASDTTILREPASMPWGERVAYVCDPDGNPVALADSQTA